MSVISQLELSGFARNLVTKLRAVTLMFAWILMGAGAASAQTTAAQSFSTSSTEVGNTFTHTIAIDNTADANNYLDMAFTHVFPSGMTVASSPTTDCRIGTLTGASGSSTISLSAGGVVAGGNCSITTELTSSTIGTNTSPDIAISGSFVGSPITAAATSITLNASAGDVVFSKSFAQPSVVVGEVNRLTYTIDNSAGTGDVRGTAFAETLPSGLIIASPANLVSSCPLGTSGITASAGTSTLNKTGNFSEILVAGATCTISVDVQTASVGTYTATSGDLTYFNSSFQNTNVGASTAMFTVVGSELLLTKTYTDGPYTGGDAPTIEYQIFNGNRTLAATDLAFTDDLSGAVAGFTFDTVTSNTCGGSLTGTGTSLLSLTGGSLAAEGSCTIVMSSQLVAGTAAGSYSSTTGAVNATVAGATFTGNTFTALLSVTASTPPTLSLSVSDTIAGDSAAVSLVFTNTSASALSDGAFTIPLSSVVSGATISNTSGSGSCGAGSFFFSSIVAAEDVFSASGLGLAANDSCTISFDLVIPAGTSSGAYTLNTSSVSSNVGGESLVTAAVSDSFNIGEPGFNLSFVKTFDTSSITAAGGTVNATYTITPNSANGVGATAINFTDLFATNTAGTTINAGAASSTCGGAVTGAGDLSFSGGAISLGGAACVITVPVTFPAGLTAGTLTSETTALNATGNTATSFGTASADLLVTSTTLMTASATFSTSSVIPGETSDLVVTFDNSAGTEAVTGLFFTANLSSAISGAATDGNASTTCAGTTSLTGTTNFVFSGGELAAGASCQATIPVVVPVATADQDATFFTSNISFTQGAMSQTASAVTARLTVQGAQLLTIKTFAADSVVAGTSTSMTIAIENQSSSAVTDVNFTDDLSTFLTGAAFTGTSSSSGCTGSVGTPASASTLFTATAFGIAANTTCSIVLNVDIPAGATPGTYTSTSSALTGDIGAFAVTGDAAFDSLQVTNGLGPVFSMAFSPSTLQVAAAGSVTYTIANPVGGNALTSVQFSSDLGSVITGLAVTGTSGTCGAGSAFAGTSVMELTGGILAEGETCTLTANFTVAAVGAGQSYTNTTSTLTSNGLVLAPEASATLAVNDVPPTFAKSFAVASFPQGGSTTLTYTIDHSGSSNTVTGLNFTDSLPTNVVIAATPAVTNSCVGTLSAVAGSGNISLLGGYIDPNDNCTITIPVTSDVVVANANISTSVLTTDVGTTPAVSASLAVTAAPIPTYTLVAAPASIVQGASTTLTFTIDNSGALVPATGLATSFAVPSGVVVNSITNSCGGTSGAGVTGFNLTGGTAAASSSCTIALNVTASEAGAFTPTGTALTTSLGNAAAASTSLTVTPATIPTMTALFSSTTIVQGLTSNLILQFDNSGSLVPATGLTFNSPLPAGFITTSSSPANTCGGTIVSTAGASSISLTGGTIAPSSLCTIGVTIRSTLEGAATFNAGVVTSSLGTTVAATAPITVTAAPAPSIAITANNSTIDEGLTSRIDIVVTNNANVGISGGAISTTLPAGLVIADTATLTTCTGATLSGAMGDSTFAITGATIVAGSNCLVRANVRATSDGVKTIPSGDFTSNLTTAPSVNGTLTVTPAPVPTSSLLLAETTFSEGGNTQLVTHINNAGSLVDATALSFTNTLPTGLVIAADPLVVNTCSGGTLTAVAGASSYSYSGGTLAAGSACFINVRVASVTANTYNIVVSDLTSSIGSPSPATATLTVTPAPAPEFNMSLAPSTISQGGTTRLTVEIDNASSLLSATNFATSFALPAGVSLSPTPNPSTTCSGGTVTPTSATSGTLTALTLDAGASCEVAFDIVGLIVGNTTITTADLTSSLGNSGQASAILEVTAAPTPTLAKSFGPTSVVQGLTSQLTIAIDNSNALVPVTGGSFSDTFPTGMVVADVPNLTTGCSDGSAGVGTAVFTAGGSSFGASGVEVPAGATCSFQISVIAVAADSYDNTTSAFVSNLGTSSVASATLEVTGAPVPVVFADATPTTFVQGGVSRITFGLDNSASLVPALNVAGNFTLPAGFELTDTPDLVDTCVGGAVTPTANGGTIALASLAEQASCSISFNVTSPTVSTTVFETSAVTSSLGTSAAGSVTVSVSAAPAPLLTLASATTNVALGADTILAYTIDNSSALVPASGIALSLASTETDLVFSAQSSTCGGTFVPSVNGFGLTGGVIPAGATCEINVTARTVVSGTYTPTTSGLVTSLGTAAATSASLTFTAEPITLSHSFNPASIAQGGTSVVTYTVDNTLSFALASAVGFADNLEAGLSIAAGTTPTTTCTGAALVGGAGDTALTLSNGGVAAGQTCTVTATVTSTTVGAIINTTGALSSSLGATAASSAPLTVTAAPVLVSSQSFAPATILQGETTVLTYTIDNLASLIAATNIAFTNVYPIGVTNAADPNVSSTCVGTTILADPDGASLDFMGSSLAAGATCTVSVSVTSSTVGNVSNANTLTSDLGQSAASVGLLSVTGAPAPTFAKTFDVASIVQGGVAKLTFRIDNSAALVGVDTLAFVDTFPAGMTVAATPNASSTCGATFTPTAGTTSANFTSGLLAAGASCTLAVDVQSVAIGTSVNLTGDLTSSLGNSGTATASLDVLAAPAIVVDVPGSTPATSVAVAGGEAFVVLQLSNPALIEATNISAGFTLPTGVVITQLDTLPSGCDGTFVAAIGGSTVSYTGGSLASGKQCEATFGVSSDVAGPYSATLTAPTSSTGTGVGGLYPLTFTPAPTPEFTMAFGDTAIEAGATTSVAFTINNGTALVDATDAAFSLTLPSGMVLAAAPAGATTCASGTVTAVAGGSVISFASGTITEATSCTVSAVVTSPVVGTYVPVTGNLVSNLGNSGTATASLEVTAPTAPTLAAVFVPAAIVQGDVSTFSLTIDNAAALIPAETVAFANTFPAGMVLAATPNATTSCGGAFTATAGAGDMSFAGGTIAAGATCVVTFDVTSPTVGAVSNVTGDVTTSLGNSNTATGVLDVTAAIAPTLVGAFVPATIEQGSVSTFSLSIDNATALVAAETVAFANTFPTGMVLASTPNATSTCGGAFTATAGAGDLSFAGGSIAAGASCVVTFDVTSPTVGTVSNVTGDVTSSLGNSGTASAALEMTAGSAPTVSSVFAPASIEQGGVSTFSFTINNALALVAADTASFANTFPSGVTVATLPNATSSCGGAVTANAGAGSMSFAGGSIAVGATCVVSVDVTSSTVGSVSNTTGDLTTSLGNSGTATAALSVTAASAPLFTNRFDPAQIPQGGTSNLIFTVDNNGNQIGASGLGFNANLPGGLVVAGVLQTSAAQSRSAAMASSSCGGTLVAAAGASTVSLSGGSVSAASTCVVSVPVTSSNIGTAGSVTASLVSSNGGSTLSNGGSEPLVVIDNPVATVTFVQNAGEDGTFSFNSSVAALNVSITTSGGTGQVGPIEVPTGTYVVSQSRPTGVGNTSLSCSDSDSTVDVPSGTVTLNLANLENVTCTYSSVNSGQEATETINAFLQRRNNLILSNGPNRSRRLARLAQGEIGGSQTLSFQSGDLNAMIPGTFNLRGIEAGNVSLSTSLIDIERAHTMFLLANDLDTEYTATLKNRRFDVWFEAHYSKFKATGGSGGHFGLAYLGADYLIDKDTLAGVILQFDTLDDTNSTTGNRVEGRGWMIGPYLTKRLAPNLIFDGRFAYGRSSNSMTTSLSSGDFDTTRMLFDVNFSGNFDWKDWVVSPNLNISYIEDSQKAFVDSLNVLVPGQKVSLGQIKFGPTFSTSFVGKNHMRYEPSITLNGVYNFSNTSGVTITNNTADESDGLRGRIEANIRMTNRHGTQVEFGANYDGIGKSDFESWGLKFGVKIPLQ